MRSNWSKVVNHAIKSYNRQMKIEAERRSEIMARLFFGNRQESLKRYQDETKRQQQEYAAWFATLKVGDEVVAGGTAVATITKVGRGFVTLQENGSAKRRVRNRHDTLLAPVTAEARQRIEKRNLLDRLSCYGGDESEPPESLETATIPQLRKIVKILGV